MSLLFYLCVFHLILVGLLGSVVYLSCVFCLEKSKKHVLSWCVSPCFFFCVCVCVFFRVDRGVFGLNKKRLFLAGWLQSIMRKCLGSTPSLASLRCEGLAPKTRQEDLIPRNS